MANSMLSDTDLAALVFYLRSQQSIGLPPQISSILLNLESAHSHSLHPSPAPSPHPGSHTRGSLTGSVVQGAHAYSTNVQEQQTEISGYDQQLGTDHPTMHTSTSRSAEANAAADFQPERDSDPPESADIQHPGPNNTAPSQNQLERIDLRRSVRIQGRATSAPYGGVRGRGNGGADGGGGGGGGGGNGANHNWTPECKRGGTQHKKKGKSRKRSQLQEESDEGEESGRWEVADAPAATARAIGDTATEIMSKVCQGVMTNLSNQSSVGWIRAMEALVKGRRWHNENGAFVVDSIQSIVNRCVRSEEIVAGVEFITMINMLHLAAKSGSLIKLHGLKAAKDVYDKYIAGIDGAPQASTFRGWVNQGEKYASLAGAGSIYLLMIIAAKGLRRQVLRVKFHVIYEMSNAIRWPDLNTGMGKDICERLIPLVDHLRHQIPLQLSTVFPKSILLERGLGGGVNCHDLDSTDSFFDTFNKNCFISVPRHRQIWEACLQPLDVENDPTPLHVMNQHLLMSYASSSRSDTSSRPASPFSDIDSDDDMPVQNPYAIANKDVHYVTHLSTDSFQYPDPLCPDYMLLKTHFNMDAEVNKREPYPIPDGERRIWTDEERVLAKNAIISDGLDDFAVKMSELYDQDGVKKDDHYLLMDEKLFDGKEMQLDGSDGSVITFIWGNLPENICSSLERNITSALAVEGSSPLVATDSESSSGFPAIHFDYYARNGTYGHGAPKEVHPNFLRRKGASRTNHCQLIPCVSKELMDHEREYENLCNSFEELFFWIEERLSERLPDIYQDLSIFTDVLPGFEVSPVHPFGGFVLNINVVTRAHRDVKDLRVCLVLVIGEHIGGELCLYEPGLVIRLRNGDMVLFPSGRITHFNLHYNGIRASIVLHSDGAGEVWGTDRNHWMDHDCMT